MIVIWRVILLEVYLYGAGMATYHTPMTTRISLVRAMDIQHGTSLAWASEGTVQSKKTSVWNCNDVIKTMTLSIFRLPPPLVVVTSQLRSDRNLWQLRRTRNLPMSTAWQLLGKGRNHKMKIAYSPNVRNFWSCYWLNPEKSNQIVRIKSWNSNWISDYQWIVWTPQNVI